jgi:hypothetical protein
MQSDGPSTSRTGSVPTDATHAEPAATTDVRPHDRPSVTSDRRRRPGVGAQNGASQSGGGSSPPRTGTFPTGATHARAATHAHGRLFQHAAVEGGPVESAVADRCGSPKYHITIQRRLPMPYCGGLNSRRPKAMYNARAPAKPSANPQRYTVRYPRLLFSRTGPRKDNPSWTTLFTARGPPCGRGHTCFSKLVPIIFDISTCVHINTRVDYALILITCVDYAYILNTGVDYAHITKYSH